MSRAQDESYADTLIRLAETDAETALNCTPEDAALSNRRALALWMADELRRESARLDLSEQTASAMRQTASTIRYRVTTSLPRA